MTTLRVGADPGSVVSVQVPFPLGRAVRRDGTCVLQTLSLIRVPSTILLIFHVSTPYTPLPIVTPVSLLSSSLYTPLTTFFSSSFGLFTDYPTTIIASLQKFPDKRFLLIPPLTLYSYGLFKVDVSGSFQPSRYTPSVSTTLSPRQNVPHPSTHPTLRTLTPTVGSLTTDLLISRLRRKNRLDNLTDFGLTVRERDV